MKSFARRAIPPRVARPARLALSYPRFWVHRARARKGFREYGDRYPQRLLFVAGLPKSGTSWLENMLGEYPGFQLVMPPSAVLHEVRNRGSHAFELTEGLMDGLRGALAVVKLHLHGSPGNAQVLRDRGLNYLIMHRDLRDVAVSHYFYVRNTPWHPEYPEYSVRDVEAGLRHFTDTLLDPFVRWIQDWRTNGDPALAHTLRYEDLLADPVGEFGRVARHFGLDDSPDLVRKIVDRHAFSRRSGRQRGEHDESSFFRKGVAGDWRNHFTPELERIFLDRAGAVLDP